MIANYAIWGYATNALVKLICKMGNVSVNVMKNLTLIKIMVPAQIILHNKIVLKV